MNTYLWYDYETFGANPVLDRPSQFAAIRTDDQLNIIGDPIMLYCKPANDFLPSPDACLITGITPQDAHEKGVIECDFFAEIKKHMMVPNTCSVGYNSINFDSEVTRHGLYRNFMEPYEQEWSNGCSRWDLIDVVRSIYALKPEKFQWPINDDGLASFRLQAISDANGITHDNAHDALNDVLATLQLAKMIKEKEPNLFNFMRKMSNKHEMSALLNVGEPVVHISRNYGSSRNNMAVVLPIARHTLNANAVLAFDLSGDPNRLFDLSADDIKQLVFAKKDDLAGDERIPLMSIQVNKCPALAPMRTLRDSMAERSHIDMSQCDANRKFIIEHPEFKALQRKVQAVFNSNPMASDDVDAMLYNDFINPLNRKLCNKVHQKDIQDIWQLESQFTDERLPELLFRFRARNFPEKLDSGDAVKWEKYREGRINQYSPGYISDIDNRLSNKDISSRDRDILEKLKAYAISVTPGSSKSNDLDDEETLNLPDSAEKPISLGGGM